MAFIDELNIKIKAGNGGDGVVRWLREKFKPKGGPAGGDGGKGGDVYIIGSPDLNLLSKYTHKKEFKAQNGQAGLSHNKHGSDGQDLKVDLPVGSVVTCKQTGKKFSLDRVGQEIKILDGGRGGLGNTNFKSSRNVAPKESTPGKEGEESDFYIELQMFADVGFIGLPNAGKSTLISILTNSKSKVGDYQFTTIDPHLGDFQGLVLADIPGLISGAAFGKGLGHKFLRHIKRTKLLTHLISFENEDLKASYQEVRKELEDFDPELADKEEVIILNKSDLVDQQRIEKERKNFASLGKKIFVLSSYDDQALKDFKKEFSELLNKEYGK